MDAMEAALKKDPSLLQRWKLEGEKEYNAYLQRKADGRVTSLQSSQIVIPIVFHLVDSAQVLAGITDRDIYEEVEILNKDYAGLKADGYKSVIPTEITARVGRVSFKFVLAKRTPSGALTSGIERRVNTTPDHISVKSFSTGGLDAWDTSKYVNVWAGTFSGTENGLLGIATFPFTTGEPQGVVIGISTLPFTSPNPRGYYPQFSEGATLSHEIGHYFYLFHTFGDQTSCNNVDFRLQSGWPLPYGDGPEGDDTPPQQEGPGSAYFGNPSQNYADGCADPSYGIMYGSFMNYYDDRALFMFSDGSRKRMEDCLNIYRPNLLTSDGATPPVAVTDAFLVTVTPRGTPERRQFLINNTPFTADVRNTGTGTLTTVTVNVQMDLGTPVSTVFPLSLAPGNDTTLTLAAINASGGSHTLLVYASAPNNTFDDFTNNDSLYSYIYVQAGSITAPFTESFSSATFPPSGWQIYNPNSNTTWTWDGASGFSSAGAATVQNFDYQGNGQLDELITPAIDLGTSDSLAVSFNVAYEPDDATDVSQWDGLEVYVSGDGGITYNLAYKKTGDQLATQTGALTTAFTALPSESAKWRTEQVNLTPYIVSGQKMLIKFRNTNAYGNNLYVDDISVKSSKLLARDAYPINISGIPVVNCSSAVSPSVSFGSNGTDTLKTLVFNYTVDNGATDTILWSGSLLRGGTAQFAIGTITALQPGVHTLTVYTSSPNRLPDEFVSNDTTSVSFTLLPIVSAPLTQGFESTTFPPANWVIDNPDDSITWQRTTAAASTGVGSMVIRNFDYPDLNAIDRFVSPVITTSAVPHDSLFLSFDYAYARGVNSIASQNLPLDTLEVLATQDCGQTFTTILKKWGEDLQTVNDPNYPFTSAFVPNSSYWKNSNIYLDPIVGTSNFQLYFVAINNHQNDLYIDNINVYTKIVPPLVKSQGYLIYPSPFRNTILIRNYRVPTTLQSIAVYNSIGQLVWKDQLDGRGITEMTVNLSSLPAGIYTVKMVYTEKTIIDRIVKQ
jgi:hypothetical protein